MLLSFELQSDESHFFIVCVVQRSSSTSCLRLWRCWQTPLPRWECFYMHRKTQLHIRSASSCTPIGFLCCNHKVRNVHKLKVTQIIKIKISFRIPLICFSFLQAAYDKVRAAKKQAEERNRKLDDKRKKIKLGQLLFLTHSAPLLWLVSVMLTEWRLFCVLCRSGGAWTAGRHCQNRRD